MKLADWMHEQNIDDAKLGAMVGADRVTISRIRRGVNRPSWELLAALKVATSDAVTPDDFLPVSSSDTKETVPAPSAA